MHKLPNKSSIANYRLVALLICVKWLLVIATSSVLIYSFLTHEKTLTLLGLKMAAAILPLIVLRLLLAPSCKCPLCRVPLLSGKSCSKNSKAKTLFGSYRLLVALEILFMNRFRCPYCNESTAMKSRR